MKCAGFLLLLFVMSLVSGCLLTKAVTVPMRVTGAVISVIPSAGNTIHDGIDKAADVVDKVPI